MPRNENRAGCILINSCEKILIVRNVLSGYWGFPKGHKEPYETYTEAAIRELQEEAGITITPDKFTHAFKIKTAKLYLARGDFPYKCKIDNREINAYDWVSLAKIKNMDTSKFTKGFLIKLEKYLMVQSTKDTPKLYLLVNTDLNLSKKIIKRLTSEIKQRVSIFAKYDTHITRKATYERWLETGQKITTYQSTGKELCDFYGTIDLSNYIYFDCIRDTTKELFDPSGYTIGMYYPLYPVELPEGLSNRTEII